LRTKTRNHRHNNGRHQNFPSERNNGMSRSTNSITAFRITQPADTFIWPAITFTRDNTALGRLTVRRTIAFVGGDFRVLFRFNLTSPFFTSMVQHSSLICLLFLRHKNVQSHWLSVTAPAGLAAKGGAPALESDFAVLSLSRSSILLLAWALILEEDAIDVYNESKCPLERAILPR
jgi:hypothetical protein